MDNSSLTKKNTMRKWFSQKDLMVRKKIFLFLLHTASDCPMMHIVKKTQLELCPYYVFIRINYNNYFINNK